MRQKILTLLQENSKLTSKEIAIMLGLTPEEVAREIADMEKEKVILGYTTLINWEKAGVENVSALIDVKVIPQRDVGFDEIASRIYRYPEVKSVFLISGSYDLSVLVEGRNLKEVASFVSRKLATLEHVQSTTTHFILKRYKQDGVVFDEQEDGRRQVVQP
ncbi:MAG: hypothetical protein PWP65_1043 [Clostridia bacterium]|nr:hypothetical protein [Clostridia bacterium]